MSERPMLVLASDNAGKLAEFRQLLAPLDLQIIPQGELGIPGAEEPHATFVENALAKARHASQLSGKPALADDSGLCVQALGNAPGVWSARYAGEPKSDARNNARLLEALNGVSDRRAYFYCILALVRHTNDPRPILCEGIWRGEIAQAADGEHGFGYDPLFWVAELGCTSARLSREQKNQHSHRGRALRALLQHLQEEAW
nr:RdgB/HAM1 family non-canonical purine NTP pyrophosphatase [Leeia aquatica]